MEDNLDIKNIAFIQGTIIKPRHSKVQLMMLSSGEPCSVENFIEGIKLAESKGVNANPNIPLLVVDSDAYVPMVGKLLKDCKPPVKDLNISYVIKVLLGDKIYFILTWKADLGLDFKICQTNQ